jgi:hypothetical protein
VNYSEWQHKRRELHDREMAERSGNLTAARPDIQKAITEQAVRELYDLTATLGERLAALEARRGPGRPPKVEAAEE